MNLDRWKKHKSGMTLVETMMALACAAVMCAGIYGAGVAVLRYSQTLRIETEVQAFAKEGVEEVIYAGMDNLANSDCTYSLSANRVNPTTAVTMQRIPEIIWHDATGTVVESSNSTAAYAEVHMHVVYTMPLSGTVRTNTYSTIVN
jgi:Tfp pilus assembly protein PilE